MELFSKRKGFSLIELLVVISVITIISAVVFVNYRSYQDQLALQRAAYKLAQDIRKTQGYVMGAKICDGCGVVPQGGYGIKLVDEDDFYIIYADNNGDKKHSTSPAPSDTTIETISFEKGVKISNIMFPVSGQDVGQASINFTPPDPETNITGWSPDVTGIRLQITVSLKLDPSETKYIEVNVPGGIKVYE
ncbi:Tfp pilus assembly protein FimT/FimU [Patescibacteria group bacterium]